MSVLRGTVLWNGGVRHAPALQQAGDPVSARTLCIGLKTAGSGAEPLQVTLRGRWAVALSTLEPGDRLEVEGALGGAVAPAQAEGAAPGGGLGVGAGTVVNIFRRGKHVRIDEPALKAGFLPDWLHLPPTKQIGGGYTYIRYLSTLRGDVDANLWCIFWENAKPGPFQPTQRDKVGINVMVVDKSFDHLPCGIWSSTKDMPEYSLQILIPGNSLCGSGLASLPFLCVGDLVRVHRIRVWQKQQRWMNLLCQKYSAVSHFEPVEAEAHTTTRGQPNPEGPNFVCRSLTHAEHPTMAQGDQDRARELQNWVRSRLSNERMSMYLKTIAELMQGAPQKGDLIVKVIDVSLADEMLTVEDGSTIEPLRVEVRETVEAVGWLFAHIEPGHWLKFRDVECHGPGFPARAHAARVSRVPTWCRDVVERTEALRGMRSDDIPAAQQAPNPRLPSWREDPEAAGRGGGAGGAGLAPFGRAKEEEPEDEGVAFAAPLIGFAGSAAADVATTEVVEHLPVAAGAAAPEAHGVALAFRLPPCTTRAATAGAGPAQLATSYAKSSDSLERLGGVGLAAERGVRCHVLGGFEVEGVTGPFGGAGAQILDLVCAHCSACGHNFAWNVLGTDVSDAKRRRRDLPCGHWAFRLEFRCSLHLRDSADRAETFEAFVADGQGELFGAAPQAVVSDPSARLQAQRRLDGILKSAEHPRPSTHCIAVYRSDGVGDASGAQRITHCLAMIVGA